MLLIKIDFALCIISCKNSLFCETNCWIILSNRKEFMRDGWGKVVADKNIMRVTCNINLSKPLL